MVAKIYFKLKKQKQKKKTKKETIGLIKNTKGQYRNIVHQSHVIRHPVKK